MEFGERRRSRKSPSFKLVSEQAWLGDEGTEIKKQITGMMRLLSDKSGRGYQRVEREGEAVKEEPQEEALSWTLPQNQAPEEPQHCWSSAPPMSHSQYDTRSKTQKILNNSKNLARPPVPAATPTESSCCMCNCKSTLQAILLELRTMRKLMQTQREEVCQKGRAQSERAVPSPPTTPFTNPTPTALYSLNRAQNLSIMFINISAVCLSQPEVQLAEDYEVFIPKAQLDSILLNYTRSGSLLFRKLVCAFFDDATLANSLPNGKRKRGLNDHRKGLDQNIVGAIKVFTEKYCTANRIEKLPGPRDWVQILQDQIKLARRRLKRGWLQQQRTSGKKETT
uniref:BEN domain containing 7 n=1 Tax=Astyanax mexicanus TaxID=7994 RepID=A0A3B1IJH0_ASTMX